MRQLYAVGAFLLVSSLAYGAVLMAVPTVGTDVTSTFKPDDGANYNTQDFPLVIKLCNKTTATDCGPIYVNIPDAYHAIIRVDRINDGGSACDYQNWNVYEQSSENTGATYQSHALCTLDADGTGGLTGVSAGTECKVFGPVGPFIWVDAGTLDSGGNSACTEFTVQMLVYKRKG